MLTWAVYRKCHANKLGNILVAHCIRVNGAMITFYTTLWVLSYHFTIVNRSNR